MARAAPAATESAKGAAGKVAEAVIEAAQVVQTFVADSEVPQDHHDEL